MCTNLEQVRFWINNEEFKSAISKLAKKPYEALTLEQVKAYKRKLYGLAKRAFLKELEELKVEV